VQAQGNLKGDKIHNSVQAQGNLKGDNNVQAQGNLKGGRNEKYKLQAAVDFRL
jgi:hypothetical protein